MRWSLYRRLRFFVWCVVQAAEMACTRRGKLRAEAQERMRREPPLAKCHALVALDTPPPPLVVVGPAGTFEIRDNALNRTAAWLHCAGGFGLREQMRGQA